MGSAYQEAVRVGGVPNDEPIDLIFQCRTALTDDGDQAHAVSKALFDKSFELGGVRYGCVEDDGGASDMVGR